MLIERCDGCKKEVPMSDQVERSKWVDISSWIRLPLPQGSEYVRGDCLWTYCPDCAERFRREVQEFNNPPKVSFGINPNKVC